MPAIDFQVNEFRTYEVRVEGLSLGFINTSGGGYTPKLNEKLQYDGTTVILKDGREFTDVPQLRTAILNSNWLVPVGNQVRTARPKAAGIMVRPTETRGNEPVVRMAVTLQQSDERMVGSIAGRKAAREATNLEATRRVPLDSQEARTAVAAGEDFYVEEIESTGDEELDSIFGEIEEEMLSFAMETEDEDEDEEEVTEDEDRQAEMRAEVDSDIIALLNWAEDDPTPAPKRTRQVKKVAQRQVTTKPSARNLPVDMQDERLTMPIVRDETETAGMVVGSVGNQQRTVIEREEEIAMNVSPATPQTPVAPKRPGITGAIVVDEQREVSRIKLSSTAGAPIRLDESAKVVSGNRESIMMGDGAQVGTRKTASAAPPVTVDGGVAVSRVLSPTKTSFVASDANTSSTAIERAAGGKQLRVEKYQDDGEVVGNVSQGARATAVATGDVQEAQAGETLQDVLPDAVSSPTPEVHRRPENDPAYEAVKMLIPDFTWDKDRPVKVRVAAALKYLEKDPQYLKGILAVETNLAREDIKKAMAEALEKRAQAKKAAK